MRRLIWALVAIQWLFGGAQVSAGQSLNSIPWDVSVDKAPPTEPGVHVAFGPQQELLMRVWLQVLSGQTIFGVSMLSEHVRVTILRDGKVIPVEVETAFVGAPASALDVGDLAVLRIVCRRADGGPFAPGEHVVTVDLGKFFEGLLANDGRRWVGATKYQDVRRFVIAEVHTHEQVIAFHNREGNYHFGAERLNEAVHHFEESLRLEPEQWQPNAALGSAYIQLKRYSDAVVVLQRAMPGWLRFSGRRGDVVPNNLAMALLGLGRDAEAAQALRWGGVPEQDVQQRLGRLRARLTGR